jgi:hypothetical protein
MSSDGRGELPEADQQRRERECAAHEIERRVVEAGETVELPDNAVGIGTEPAPPQRPGRIEVTYAVPVDGDSA